MTTARVAALLKDWRCWNVSLVVRRDAAIEQVYRERFAVFVGAVRGVVGSSEVARDVVQDGFARALEQSGRFRGGSLEAWIWRIVMNRALDERRRRPTVPLHVEPATESGDVGSWLVEAVLALPERRRAMVLLRYVAGLGNGEIALALGVSEGTVAATLSQARESLAVAMRAEVGR
jgi:RNA polymerase sigma-70 factor (ECF subfamily)